MLNNKFELPDGSCSVPVIQGYIEYKTLPTNPPIHIQINRINSRLMFKRRDSYKLELKTPESMKFFGSRKKLI